MIESGKLSEKKILLIDREEKELNDRTWCYWETEVQARSNPFASIVCQSYDRLWLRHPDGDINLQLDPYQYKMIRGLDFYRYCFTRIRQASNVTVLYAEVSSIDNAAGIVTAGNNNYTASRIFSSVLTEAPMLAPRQYYLLQHFLGWWIETDEDFFIPGEGDLMNFRTTQQHGCTFVYVLPVGKRRALVEYTLFSEVLLSKDAYGEGLKKFIEEELKLENYHIKETEYGVIPMTNIRFPAIEGRIMFIGTAGGQTKASTGYTFSFIQKQSAAIVECLVNGRPLGIPYPARRFRFYDSVLLRVLHERKIPGADVFYRMFKKNKASAVLRFLDNESNYAEELAIMNSADKSIFVPAAIRELL